MNKRKGLSREFMLIAAICVMSAFFVGYGTAVSNHRLAERHQPAMVKQKNVLEPTAQAPQLNQATAVPVSSPQQPIGLSTTGTSLVVPRPVLTVGPMVSSSSSPTATQAP